VLSLAQRTSATKGVDSVHGVQEAAEVAAALAERLGFTVAITGEEDFVTNGDRSCWIANGHPLMGKLTGSGCTATALIGAFLAVEEDPVAASAGALAYFGVAGEKAAETADAPGSYQVALLDALYRLTPEELKTGARMRS
jgi:hydroxyethylthiazole kinase